MHHREDGSLEIGPKKRDHFLLAFAQLIFTR